MKVAPWTTAIQRAMQRQEDLPANREVLKDFFGFLDTLDGEKLRQRFDSVQLHEATVVTPRGVTAYSAQGNFRPTQAFLVVQSGRVELCLYSPGTYAVRGQAQGRGLATLAAANVHEDLRGMLTELLARMNTALSPSPIAGS